MKLINKEISEFSRRCNLHVDNKSDKIGLIHSIVWTKIVKDITAEIVLIFNLTDVILYEIITRNETNKL